MKARAARIPKFPAIRPYGVTVVMSITAALGFAEGDWGTAWACVTAAVGWALADYYKGAVGRPAIIPTWHGPVCYHRKRRCTVDNYADLGATTLRCEECGASVTASYGAPLPELPPMPMDTRLTVERGGAE